MAATHAEFSTEDTKWHFRAELGGRGDAPDPENFLQFWVGFAGGCATLNQLISLEQDKQCG